MTTPGVPQSSGLRLRTQRALMGVTLLFLEIQLIHTCLDQINWPFADNGFFAFIPPLKQDVVKLALEEDTGRRQVVDVWCAVPLDYWLVPGIFEKLYQNPADEARRRAFAELVLQWSNGPGWLAFDEFQAAVHPSPGARFVRVDVELHSLDFGSYRYGTTLVPSAVTTLYTYPPLENR